MTPDHPRPSLLRSPLLWLGVMMLAFLGWAWRDSASRWSYMEYGPASAVSQASGVTLGYAEHIHSPWRCGTHPPSAASVRFFLRFPELLKPRFARPGLLWKVSSPEWTEFRATGTVNGRLPEPMLLAGVDDKAWKIFIPYWCFVLAVLLPWLGLIYWRHRRLRRVAGVPSPEPEASHDT